jgi:hypothetical protein
MILQNPELLTPSASDCAARRRLTKSEDKETIIINRSGRSTYPEEKSVQTSGATPIGDHDIRIERADMLAGLARKYGTIALGAAVLEMSTERMHWYGLDLRRF